MDHAAGCGSWPATTGHGVLDRRDRQARFHPGIDGIANDLVAVDILDCAHVQLPLTVGVLRNIGHPRFVDRTRGEVAFDEVITHPRAGRLAVFPGSFDGVGEQLVLRVQSPHTTLRGPVAGGVEFISDEPVPDTEGSSVWMS